MSICFRTATQADAEYVGAHLRAEDAMEVFTATGRPPHEVLPESFQRSRECYVAVADGEDSLPYCIFGVVDDPNIHGLGIVWLLATDDLLKHKLATFRASAPWLEFMSRHYPLGLHSLADSRNIIHVRWCIHAGFKIQGGRKLNGQTFIHIYRENTDV